jgi:hypothetical protein
VDGLADCVRGDGKGFFEGFGCILRVFCLLVLNVGIFVFEFLNDLFEFGNSFMELDVFDEHLLIFGFAQFDMLDFVLLGLDHLLLFLYLSFQLIYLLLLTLQMQILLRL